MATQNAPMIWASPELIAALPLTKPFTAVQKWDNEARKFLDQQDRTDDGQPVWESEALLQMGWGRTLGPARIRVAGDQPRVQPDPAKVMAAMGLTQLPTSPTTAPAAAPSASIGEPLRKRA